MPSEPFARIARMLTAAIDPNRRSFAAAVDPTAADSTRTAGRGRPSPNTDNLSCERVA
jgi:hypothetical protein